MASRLSYSGSSHQSRASRRYDGAEVSAVRLENVPRHEIADRLQNEAQAHGADLMVAGAFGHPRLWEKMLGGVTHDLIARMRLPVLMSH